VSSPAAPIDVGTPVLFAASSVVNAVTQSAVIAYALGHAALTISHTFAETRPHCPAPMRSPCEQCDWSSVATVRWYSRHASVFPDAPTVKACKFALVSLGTARHSYSNFQFAKASFTEVASVG